MTPEHAPGTGRIVVGIDGSPSSLDALSWAARQADLTGSSLEIVMTWEWPSSYGWAAPDPRRLRPRRGRPAARSNPPSRRCGPSTPDLSIDPRVVSGHPAPILVEASKGADLLVVGQPGPRRVRRDAHRLGQRVLRHERALPGPRAPGDRVDGWPAQTAAIVVGVDGSPPSERALDWAIGEAQRTGASLRLVTRLDVPHGARLRLHHHGGRRAPERPGRDRPGPGPCRRGRPGRPGQRRDHRAAAGPGARRRRQGRRPPRRGLAGPRRVRGAPSWVR